MLKLKFLYAPVLLSTFLVFLVSDVDSSQTSKLEPEITIFESDSVTLLDSEALKKLKQSSDQAEIQRFLNIIRSACNQSNFCLSEDTFRNELNKVCATSNGCTHYVFIGAEE